MAAEEEIWDTAAGRAGRGAAAAAEGAEEAKVDVKKEVGVGMRWGGAGLSEVASEWEWG